MSLKLSRVLEALPMFADYENHKYQYLEPGRESFIEIGRDGSEDVIVLICPRCSHAWQRAFRAHEVFESPGMGPCRHQQKMIKGGPL